MKAGICLILLLISNQIIAQSLVYFLDIQGAKILAETAFPKKKAIFLRGHGGGKNGCYAIIRFSDTTEAEFGFKYQKIITNFNIYTDTTKQLAFSDSLKY